MSSDNDLVEMELREVQMKDDVIASQVIILAEKTGERTFPIFIGYNEAFALDMTLHNFKSERPMTHDLIYNVIEGLGAELHHIRIDDLKNNTFYGKLVLRAPGEDDVMIDTRPSDAIVLAMKRQLPIYVAEMVLDKVSREDEEE